MLSALTFLAGLAALALGADALVRGASKLALSVGISPLVVGLTIVAFGTSAPELAVSVGATLRGQTDIAVGNVVGSNVFNVLFILGASALVTPLAVNRQLVRQDVPVMIGASLLLVALGLDGSIGLWDGALLSGLLLGYTAFLVVQSRRLQRRAGAARAAEPGPGAAAARVPRKRSWADRIPAQLALVAAGLALLVLGSDWLVTAAVTVARALGVSDLVIGLTVVAAGTSMPETATSIAAGLKGERDIAVGNVVGSNMFNILGCVGLSAVASGGRGLPMASSLEGIDLWVMLAVAVACLPVFLIGLKIARWEGALMLGYYAAYVGYQVLAASGNAAALGALSAGVLYVALPLTAVAMVVSLVRRRVAPTSQPGP